MPSTVPTPIAAALGLVPAALSGVRALPGKVIQIPILAVSSALTALDASRRGYDDLAERGERLVARLRGTSFDEIEDAVEEALQGTPVAGLYDAVEDAAEDALDGAGRALTSVARTVTGAGAATATRNAAQAVKENAEKAKDTVADAATTTTQAAAGAVRDAVEQAPAAQAPTSRPAPKASAPAETRVDSAASADAVRTAQAVTATAGEVVAHDDLPLPDYDHMTLGSLRGRLRSLSLLQLGQVRAYEKAHADRLPVVTMLDNRIAKLAADGSATPTGNVDAPTVPELQPSQIGVGGSKVSPATSGPA